MSIMRCWICQCQSYKVAICRSASNSANRLLMTSRSAPAFSQRTPSLLPQRSPYLRPFLPANAKKSLHPEENSRLRHPICRCKVWKTVTIPSPQGDLPFQRQPRLVGRVQVPTRKRWNDDPSRTDRIGTNAHEVFRLIGGV